jgi:hypothetical protein
MNIEDLAFYMMDDKVHSAKITSKMIVENQHEDWAYTPEQIRLCMPFGEAGTFYATTHGIFEEGKIFPTKEELINSL